MAFTKITASGIGSTETVTIDGLSVINDGSFGGNVSVGGTLTYEDVTNIDSVGLITARAGVVVGSGITLSVDGDGFFTGVVTATSYAGDGSALTGISVDSTQIVTGNTSVQTVDTGSDGHVKVNTEGSERLRIIADGKVGVNKTAPNFHLDVAGNVGLTEGQVITWHDGSGTKAGDMYIDSSDNFIIRNTSSVSERFRIASDGKVGIGDNSPDALLVIKGDSDSATTPSIRLKDGTDTREAWITNTSGDLILANGGDDNTPHCYLKMFDGNIMIFATANTERLRVDQNGIVTKPNHPYFRADLATSQQNVNLPDGAVKFSASGGLNGHYFTEVKYNNGSHYNSSNSRFTAPVDGLYQFIQEIAFHGSGTTIAYLGCELYVNDNRWNAGWSNQAAGYQVERRVWMIELDANDYVEPGYELSSSGNSLLIADGNLRRPYNTFQGFLIA